MAEESEHRARRRRTGDKRDQRVVLKLSLAELAAAKIAAEKEGLATTAWIGKVVEAAADPEAPMAGNRASRAELKVVAEASFQLKQAGNLFNQAVAALHRNGEPPERFAEYARDTWTAAARVDDEATALRKRHR